MRPVAHGTDGAAPGWQAWAGESDAALVRLVLDGERDAFAALVVRHQAALFRFARGMGVSRETAQDLVQDTLVRAFTRLQQCRDAARFRSWIVSILRNSLMDHHRDVRRGEVRLDDVASAGLASAGTIELRGALREALDALPPLLREAFLLRHHHGYSYDEVAAITGARVSAVKMRVHRAREQLRGALGDDVTDRPSHPSAV
jgi:RNA polymerase sigma-70 factor, ECF subfamily